MYDILKNRICNGGFKLADIQGRAKKLYAMGDLTDTQLEELMQLSQKNAVPDAERPEVMEMLKSISDRLHAVEQRLTLDGSVQPGNPETPEVEAWKPWDGISNNYQHGAVVSHKNKLWQSDYNGQNVWEPGTVGTETLWVEYVEEVEFDV